jgi:hypothetical protein
MVFLRRSGHGSFMHGYTSSSPPSSFNINLSAIISATHVHVASEKLNIRKRNRLAIRVAVALVILLLPLAHSLNSLQLIGIVTALLWFVIGIETWGNAYITHTWCGEKKKKQYMCKYNYKCVQGEEGDRYDEDEKRSSEDGDIIFGV